MWDRGWWTIARWRGAPVRIHWSLPLSALVIARFRLDPSGWLGLVLVVLAHEIGHAVLVRHFRLKVVRIDLHGMGGECRYAGYATPWQASVIAWGGVLAQLVLLPIGYLVAPRLTSPAAHSIAWSFGAPSLWMLVFNLLPIPPLDGADAWRIVGLWRRERRDRYRRLHAERQVERSRRAQRDAARALADLERHDGLPTSSIVLPEEVATQIQRAVQRAHDEGAPRHK